MRGSNARPFGLVPETSALDHSANLPSYSADTVDRETLLDHYKRKLQTKEEAKDFLLHL